MLRNIGMVQQFALRHAGLHQKQMMKHMERLSSGQRINRAADDPAGLAISERMRAQIRGIEQAKRNVLDGVSLIRTAEGGLSEQHSMLQRVRELSVQSANDIYSSEDRAFLQQEVDQILQEMIQVRNNTMFNNNPLYQGGELRLQTGANAGQFMTINLPDTELSKLAIDGLDISTREGASGALELVDGAIQSISSHRSRLGAYENRLEHTYNHLTNYRVQLTSSESRIRDVDMAREMMGLVKHQLLQQVSVSMMMQANQQQSMILTLLNGK
ncbi:flagellin [Salipaludibacillus keqinensis]|jgi:flagellin|uniref:Flagellin n=1 Tax=Salipaludibacillus keqinensis TaxID=2045207 RepID=A0A323TX72_9BACI|nr:flagellin [Salipaludibacillus keqinensis]PYZ94185.1 flagellin [Salipaludibacillus keqinensis]